MIAADHVQPLAGGFAFGLAMILSLGPQNLQLIERGITRSHPLAAASVGYAVEVGMVALAIGGVGAAVSASDIAGAAHLAAAAFLAACGIRGLRSGGGGRAVGPTRSRSLREVAVAMLAVSLLNPLVYLETVILGGTLASAFGGLAPLFGIGLLAAAALRFFGLALLGGLLAPHLRSPLRQRRLSQVAGGLLLAVAASQVVAVG